MITVRGARENNLVGVDLDLTPGRLIVFCGVSGSGKSSMAFDTLHAEGRRRYLEALALDRGAVAVPPAVDHLAGLPPTIGLSQRWNQPPARATVGGSADLVGLLRILFARGGTQHCPICDRVVRPQSHDEIVDALLQRPGRILVEAPIPDPHPGVLEEVERAGFSRIRVGDSVLRLEEVDPSALAAAPSVRIVVDRIRVSADRRPRVADSIRLAAQAGRGAIVVVDDEGEQAFVDRPLCVHDQLLMPALSPDALDPDRPPGACPTCEGMGEGCSDCGGSRYAPAARAVRWRGHTLPDLVSWSASSLCDWLDGAGEDPVQEKIIADVRRRLVQFDRLQLGHLPLARRAAELSRSELQRLRLVRQVASPLAGVLYVLDEPAAGLPVELMPAVVALLRGLVDAGNTVVAVEHHSAVVRVADHLVEFGPGSGLTGGRIVYQGDVAGLLAADTPTGRWLSGRASLTPPTPWEGTAVATVTGPWLHGTARPDVVLPRGGVVAISGPAGSGKSTLLRVVAEGLGGGDTAAGVQIRGIAGLDRVARVDRGVSRSPRSTPATFVGLWDLLRGLLASTRPAKIRGFTPGTFSLNTGGGRCSVCRGTGQRRVDLGPLPDVVLSCPVCLGSRFEADVLEVRYKGLDASEILALSGEEARRHLAGHPAMDRILTALVEVGLGYLPLGQPASTLSGGEAMRLSLARELARAAARGGEDTVYLLDDPSIGLHPQDVALLLTLLRGLRDRGATVWLTTSNPDLAAAADQVIHLPPTSMDNAVE